MTHDAVPERRAGGRTLPPARALAALFGALALGACTLHDERPVALAAPEPPAAPARPAAAPEVKTVRRSAAAIDAAAREDDAGPSSGATPAPRQIFDFHPAGSHPDSWRQPFIIDPNDGPLAGDVRRSAAELKAFLALPKVDPKADPRLAARHRCSETDVATAKPGCTGPVAAAAPAAGLPAAR